MIVKGKVYKLSGNYAHVETPRPKACESCSNYSLCSGKDVDMKVLNNIGANIGDIVEIEVSEDQRAIYIMAYLFLIPVAMILSRIAVKSVWFESIRSASSSGQYWNFIAIAFIS